MQKLYEIQNVYDAEIDLIKKQSAILLQHNGGFNGELKTAGAIIENYVKGLLQKHLPSGYRICSGYIATTETINDANNLIQHDIIIVDNRIPSLYKFGIGDIEIVAAESVCGIIEVKRTLTKKSLTDAIDHLGITKNILDKYDGGVKSKNKPSNGLFFNGNLNSATEAPIYAIIGINADKEIAGADFRDEKIMPALNGFLDLIWSASSPYCIGLEWKVGEQRVVADHVSRSPNGFSCNFFIEGFDTVKNEFDTEKSGLIFRGTISTLRTWISHSSCSPMTVEKNYQYFGMGVLAT